MGEDPTNFLWDNRLRRAGKPWTWGYVIYRTVYTPESDAIWDSVLSKIEAYIFREVDQMLWADYNTLRSPYARKLAPQTVDPAPFTEVREHLQHKIMDDRSLYDGLSIPQVRQKFLEFRTSCIGSELMNLMMGNMCLMIDQEVLECIRDAPEPTRRSPEDIEPFSPEQPFAKVIAPTSSDPENSAYDGWMRCSLCYLYGLYVHNQTMEMELIFPYHDPVTGERDMYEGKPLGFRASGKPSHIKSRQPIPEMREVDKAAPISSSLGELKAHYAQAGESEVPPHIENLQKMNIQRLLE